MSWWPVLWLVVVVEAGARGSEVEVRSQAPVTTAARPPPATTTCFRSPAPAGGGQGQGAVSGDFQQFKLISNRLHNYDRGGRAEFPSPASTN